MGTGVVTLRIKRQEREANLSPPSSANTKNGGATASLSLRLHGVVLNYLRPWINLIYFNTSYSRRDIAHFSGL
jgi:hypothetical protein